MEATAADAGVAGIVRPETANRPVPGLGGLAYAGLVPGGGAERIAIDRIGRWSRDMPALSLMGVLALLAAMTLARSPLSALLAWPLAAVAGAAVIFWQTMVMVGPGSPGERLDAIYFRFQAWFQMAFSGGISNDPLLSNVMVIGLTWLGVFLFGWSIFRWHNPGWD